MERKLLVFFASVVGSVKEYICESFIWVVKASSRRLLVSVVRPWGVEHDGMAFGARGIHDRLRIVPRIVLLPI